MHDLSENTTFTLYFSECQGFAEDKKLVQFSIIVVSIEIHNYLSFLWCLLFLNTVYSAISDSGLSNYPDYPNKGAWSRPKSYLNTCNRHRIIRLSGLSDPFPLVPLEKLHLVYSVLSDLNKTWLWPSQLPESGLSELQFIRPKFSGPVEVGYRGVYCSICMWCGNTCL